MVVTEVLRFLTSYIEFALQVTGMEHHAEGFCAPIAIMGGDCICSLCFSVHGSSFSQGSFFLGELHQVRVKM